MINLAALSYGNRRSRYVEKIFPRNLDSRQGTAGVGCQGHAMGHW